jgi:hypothetical protein
MLKRRKREIVIKIGGAMAKTLLICGEEDSTKTNPLA